MLVDSSQDSSSSIRCKSVQKVVTGKKLLTIGELRGKHIHSTRVRSFHENRV